MFNMSSAICQHTVQTPRLLAPPDLTPNVFSAGEWRCWMVAVYHVQEPAGLVIRWLLLPQVDVQMQLSFQECSECQ